LERHRSRRGLRYQGRRRTISRWW